MMQQGGQFASFGRYQNCLARQAVLSVVDTKRRQRVLYYACRVVLLPADGGMCGCSWFSGAIRPSTVRPVRGTTCATFRCSWCSASIHTELHCCCGCVVLCDCGHGWWCMLSADLVQARNRCACKFMILVVLDAEVGDQWPPIILYHIPVLYYAVSTASAVLCAR